MSADSDSVVGRFLKGVIRGDDADSAVRQRHTALKRTRLLRRLSQFALLVVIGILLVGSLVMVGFWREEWIQYWPEFTDALTQYFPPELYFGFLPAVDVGRYYQFWVEAGLVGEAGITLAIALAGTILGAPLALLFGILGNERVTPFPINFLFRGVMSIIRSIPSLVWALIYVPLGGISPVTATLAIGTDTIGELGRLLTDELEEIDDGPIEGISSTGADKPQVITFGMITQIVRPFIAWSMFILENNVRSAVGLGIIGAGGLGVTLSIEQQTFKFTNMMATILFIVLLVLSVEMISQRTRSYLRGGDDDEGLSLYDRIVGLPERLSKSLF
ncbi:phosphonate ABC transporter, permease protein PhnE [Halonotius roseus]|uniref:Phosphonate ABC transporter, permease protein PhnE n=1 Tax=Halonotius roseus TaxID=2511997 RepID=A0A544QQB2_9EURY|nr:phosphonate ABC transporter, permease protein PhnE [Halonotius roseus]TQQ81627.1 phosphonate ABC transporter, permease protein PhnE [Halonotius roseus]